MMAGITDWSVVFGPFSSVEELDAFHWLAVTGISTYAREYGEPSHEAYSAITPNPAARYLLVQAWDQPSAFFEHVITPLQAEAKVRSVAFTGQCERRDDFEAEEWTQEGRHQWDPVGYRVREIEEQSLFRRAGEYGDLHDILDGPHVVIHYDHDPDSSALRASMVIGLDGHLPVFFSDGGYAEPPDYTTTLRPQWLSVTDGTVLPLLTAAAQACLRDYLRIVHGLEY